MRPVTSEHHATLISEQARVLGRDVHEARDIESGATLYAAEDRTAGMYLVKNGYRNSIHFSLVGANDFASWLVAMLALGNDRIGIYVAKHARDMMGVRDRMCLAADVGRVPEDVREVAVVLAREANEVLERVASAQDRVGLDALLVHDETGERDDDALLGTTELAPLDVPDWIQDRRHRTSQFMGEIPPEREHIAAMYLHAASQSCMNAMSYQRHSPRMSFRQADSEKSATLVCALSCGHEKVGGVT